MNLKPRYVECNEFETEVSKVEKPKDSWLQNILLRNEYHKNLKEYQTRCKTKRYVFLQSKFEITEKSLRDSKLFWDNKKNTAEVDIPSTSPNISGKQWFVHFSKMYNEEKRGQISKTNYRGAQIPGVDNQPFPKEEFQTIIKSLKTKQKAESFDFIASEMINTPLMRYLTFYITL